MPGLSRGNVAASVPDMDAKATILLVEPNPRQLLPPPRQLVAATRQLLLRLEQFEARGQPLSACPGYVCRHCLSPSDVLRCACLPPDVRSRSRANTGAAMGGW